MNVCTIENNIVYEYEYEYVQERAENVQSGEFYV